MDWLNFQTYGESKNKAFEAMCNQLFEKWCHREYDNELLSTYVINGEGGDGGVESIAEYTGVAEPRFRRVVSHPSGKSEPMLRNGRTNWMRSL